jgi:phosphocarrier protein HPr
MIGGTSPVNGSRLTSDRLGDVGSGFSTLFQDPSTAMNGEMIEQKVVITNPQGFHLRPMAAFAEMANRFQSEVTVCKEDKRVNGKSPLELMFLAAEQGTELLVQVSGPDAPDALKALVNVMAKETPDEETSDLTPLPPKG